MITPQKDKEPDLALAGLALLVIFGLLMWHDNPIKSDRPFDPSVMQPQYPHTTGYAYESWLWQDPFGFDSSAYDRKDQYYIEYDDEEGNKTFYQYRKHKKIDLEVNIQDKHAKESDASQCTVQLTKKINGIKEDKKDNGKQPVKILASLLKVRPNTIENKEIRARHRYAMIAGLMESGYYPSEPDRLYFCSSQGPSDDDIEYDSNGDKKFDVRWEHYAYKDNNKPDIILAWIDSNTFDIDSGMKNNDAADFVEKINCLLASKDEQCTDYKNNFYIFDWVNASNLKEKFSEILKGCKKNGDNNKHQACTDEAPEKTKACKSYESPKETDGPKCGNEKKCSLTEQLDKSLKNVEFIKSTGTDQELAKKLTEELKLRNIKELSEVAIITELDSENVRERTQAFKNCFSEYNKHKQQEIDNNFNDTNGSDEIKTFTYFKGLDAYQQVIDKQDQNDANQAGKKWSDRLSVTDLHNPPIGPGQFDYLNRLAGEIKASHDVIDLDKRVAGIKAVGIFGSDFYDKLLILKALRTEMPNLLVFTTGMDAQMLHPQHWRWTRNLVVASDFGLRLHENHQKHFPAFRDSRQTDIYYQTLLAADYNGKLPKKEEGTELLIHEIGRNGAVRLYAQAGEESSGEDCHKATNLIHPCDDSWKQTEQRLVLLFGITLVLIFLIANFRAHSGTLFVWLLFSAILIFFFAWVFAIEKVGEPLSFTNGTSLWPTIFIQLIAISLALALIFKSVCMLEGNLDRLNKQYKEYLGNAGTIEPLCTDSAPASLIDVSKEICRLIDKLKTNKNYYYYGLSVSFLLLGSIIYALNDGLPVAFPFYACFISLFLLTISYILITYNNDFKSIKYLIEKDNCDVKTKGTEAKNSNHENSPCIKTGGKDNNDLNTYLGFCFFFFSSLIPSIFLFLFSSIWWSLVFLLSASILFVLLLIKYPFKVCSTKSELKLDQNSDHGSESSQAEDLCRKIITLDGANGLWQEYYAHGRLQQRLIRITAMWLFFAIIETILFYLLPPWPSPCRGGACSWDWFIGIVGFIVIMLLVFFVLDAVRLNFYWIRKLRTKHPLLVDRPRLGTKGVSGQDILTFVEARENKPLERLEKIVILIAERTKVVDKLIYYPLLCIMLMLFARITYFDNQDFPLSKGITFAASISLLIFSGFVLRYEAQQLRRAVIQSAQGLVKNNGIDKTEADETIEKISGISSGVFQPMLEQPVMRALLLILASAGLFASEYLMLFGFS